MQLIENCEIGTLLTHKRSSLENLQILYLYYIAVKPFLFNTLH